MSQQKVDSPELIYNTLTGDTAFMALVGKRVFKAGNTELDAISISTPGEDLPAIKSMKGLEVVIHDVTAMRKKQYITSDYEIEIAWKIFLLAWPNANGSTLNAAATRILELFSKGSTIETVPLNSDIGAIAQLLVLIPSDSVILA